MLGHFKQQQKGKRNLPQAKSSSCFQLPSHFSMIRRLLGGFQCRSSISPSLAAVAAVGVGAGSSSGPLDHPVGSLNATGYLSCPLDNQRRAYAIKAGGNTTDCSKKKQPMKQPTLSASSTRTTTTTRHIKDVVNMKKSKNNNTRNNNINRRNKSTYKKALAQEKKLSSSSVRPQKDSPSPAVSVSPYRPTLSPFAAGIRFHVPSAVAAAPPSSPRTPSLTTTSSPVAVTPYGPPPSTAAAPSAHTTTPASVIVPMMEQPKTFATYRPPEPSNAHSHRIHLPQKEHDHGPAAAAAPTAAADTATVSLLTAHMCGLRWGAALPADTSVAGGGDTSLSTGPTDGSTDGPLLPKRPRQPKKKKSSFRKKKLGVQSLVQMYEQRSAEQRAASLFTLRERTTQQEVSFLSSLYSRTSPVLSSPPPAASTAAATREVLPSTGPVHPPPSPPSASPSSTDTTPAPRSGHVGYTVLKQQPSPVRTAQPKAADMYQGEGYRDGVIFRKHRDQ